MTQSLLTLAATVVGALLGLFAPMVAAVAGRRARARENQHDVASAILDLFAGGESLATLLTGRESVPRRRLYLLAVRLERERARRACVELVGYAGGDDPDGARMAQLWDTMVNEVSAVLRSRR